MMIDDGCETLNVSFCQLKRPPLVERGQDITRSKTIVENENPTRCVVDFEEKHEEIWIRQKVKNNSQTP